MAVINIAERDSFCPIGIGPLVGRDEFLKFGGRHTFLAPGPKGIFLPADEECGFVQTEVEIDNGTPFSAQRCKLCEAICFQKKVTSNISSRKRRRS
jgi:hypothetical protein